MTQTGNNLNLFPAIFWGSLVSSNQELGRTGENLAVAHLERSGYLILERNVFMRRGEIDVIARQGGDLVFVEVKTRTSNRFGTPEDAITPAKIRSLARAVQEYLYANLLMEESARCDVVTVSMDTPGHEPCVKVFRDAVELGEALRT